MCGTNLRTGLKKVLLLPPGDFQKQPLLYGSKPKSVKKGNRINMFVGKAVVPVADLKVS